MFLFRVQTFIIFLFANQIQLGVLVCTGTLACPLHHHAAMPEVREHAVSANLNALNSEVGRQSDWCLGIDSEVQWIERLVMLSSAAVQLSTNGT